METNLYYLLDEFFALDEFSQIGITVLLAIILYLGIISLLKKIIIGLPRKIINLTIFVAFSGLVVWLFLR